MGFIKGLKKQATPTEQPTLSLNNPYHFVFTKAGTQFVGTDKPLFQKQLSAEKIRQPILHLNEGSGLKLVSFDFDTKDPAVHAAVWANFAGWAIIARSPSGNIKALVPVSGYASKELSLEERRAYITATLKRLKIDHLCIPDLSAGALNLCFISKDIYRAMRDYLADEMPIMSRQQFQDSLPKDSIPGENTDLIVKQTQERPKFQYFQATRDTFNPTLTRYIKRTARGTALRLKLVQILVATWGLVDATDGFGLSSKVLADQIGCSHTFILNELRILQELKLLECQDDTHCYVGAKAKAKTYLADGALEQEVKKEKATKGTRVGRLPTQIADGTWHDVILKYLWKFKDIHTFRAWITNIPGYHIGDRPRKAESMARCHFRKQHLKGLGDCNED